MRSILFVDAEPLVRDGLRRLLRPMRKEWEMEFVGGSTEALAALEARDFDVIVTDTRIPKIDGVELLRIVQDKYPRVVRIVLSGNLEMKSALRTIPVAHQFLSKPCDAQLLQRTVERATGLNQLLADREIQQFVGGIEGLPALPRIYLALTKLLSDPEASLKEAAALVSRDIGISAKVLQLANSAMFGPAKRIANVEHAVTYLGSNMLRSVVLMFEVFEGEQTSTVPGFDAEELQLHGMATAVVAAKMATNPAQRDDVITAAILHDIGELILASNLPETYGELVGDARASGCTFHEVERRRNGVTHAEVGAYLLGLWGLPYRIIEAVAYHHFPAAIATNTLDVVSMVHISDCLVHEWFGEREEIDIMPPTLDESYLAGLGLLNRLPAWRAMADRELESLIHDRETTSQ